jgi:hypothetical protein
MGCPSVLPWEGLLWVLLSSVARLWEVLPLAPQLLAVQPSEVLPLVEVAGVCLVLPQDFHQDQQLQQRERLEQQEE